MQVLHWPTSMSNTDRAEVMSASSSYQQFAITTERSKRPEYACKYARLNSYDEWPRGHHLKKEDLTDAGFYFAGKFFFSFFPLFPLSPFVFWRVLASTTIFMASTLPGCTLFPHLGIVVGTRNHTECFFLTCKN